MFVALLELASGRSDDVAEKLVSSAKKSTLVKQMSKRMSGRDLMALTEVDKSQHELNDRDKLKLRRNIASHCAISEVLATFVLFVAVGMEFAVCTL